MPKIPERDANSKIKTKEQNRSGHKKKKSNISPQVQTVIQDKANQHREKEAPTEYAVNTTEEVASEIAAGTAALSSSVAGAVYTKVKSGWQNKNASQEEPFPDSSDTSPEQHADGPGESPPRLPKTISKEEMSQTEARSIEISPVERGRNLAVHAHAEKQADSTPQNQPKVKPDVDYIPQLTPKTKELLDHIPPENHTTGLAKAPSVEQGRKLAIQSHIKQRADQAEIPPKCQPKIKPDPDFGSQITPKTKDPLAHTAVRSENQAVGLTTINGNNSLVEQGRNLAMKSYIDKSGTSPDYQPVSESYIDYGSNIEQVAGASLSEKQVVPHNRIQNLVEQRQSTAIPLPSGEQAASDTDTMPDAVPKIRERTKEKLAPKQKPKIEPKIRNQLEHSSTKMIRPERSDRSARVLTNAQKAVEMGRKKFMREAQKQMQQQIRKAAEFTAGVARKAAAAVGKAIHATITMLASAFGGVGVVAILTVILLVGAFLASPFGILFANEPAPNAIPLSAAVSQISAEFSARLEELQQGEYDEITVIGNPPDWKEVIAVFACHVAGGERGVDVMSLDEEKVDRLRTVFWDMCVLTAEEEIEEWTGPTTPTDSSTEPVKTLTITIEAKTAEDMRAFYSFSKLQNDALTELLAEKEMLNSLIGNLEVSEEEAIDLLNRMPSDVSTQRKAVVQQALTLVGKVNYFWGGKSLVIGWDSRWGQPMEVWAAGSPTTGTIRPYGLDCSGFTDWVFYNVSSGSYILGHGGGVATQHTYCASISWAQAQPGDLAFYSDDSHVGIVGGWDDAGNLLIIHCASGANNVVITGKSGFALVGRPYYYSE